MYLLFLGLWWLGASFLVAGSVIIGRREEGKETGTAGTAGAEPAVAVPDAFQDEPDAPPAPAEGVKGADVGDYSDSIELKRKPRDTTFGDEEEDDE